MLDATKPGAVLDAVAYDEMMERAGKDAVDNQFVTSNGVVFRLKPVPPLLIVDAQRRFVEPVPPKIRNLDKGEGDEAPLEENPNDPGYVRAMEQHRQALGEATNAIFLVRGTEIASVPDGVSKVEDADWAEDVHEFAGIDVPKAGRRRYYCWVKYVALASMDDFQGILNKLTSLGGATLESDVAAAEETFRPASDGGADKELRTS